MSSIINTCRMDLSSYHHADFSQWEKQKLESIPGLTYSEQINTDSQNILLTNTHTKFDRFTEAELDSIVLVVHANSGFDNIPVSFARNQHFNIVVGNPIRSQAVATYVLSQLFAHYNPAPHVDTWQKGRQWDRKPMDSLNVLLLGLGHIGKIVHAALSPIVARILVHDPFLDMELDYQQHLADIDVVIPLMSLNPTSKNFISHDFLHSLKDGFVIINGARGDLIDQGSLLTVLRNKPNAFAYLDVFQDEPFNESDFAGLENIRLSSHVAGVFRGIDRSILEFEEQILGDFVSMQADNFEGKYESLILRNRIFGDFLI